MPLEGLFEEIKKQVETQDHRRTLYEFCGVLSNPFPSAGQTSGHPHYATEADQTIDREIISFFSDRKSHVIAVTATQGIGKTNLLNAYEKALQEKLGGLGFFVIKYVADPDRFFDKLIISIFEYLGEEHLKKIVAKLVDMDTRTREDTMNVLRTIDVRSAFENLLRSYNETDELFSYAYQWLLGLPLRKPHREQLKINSRLDTVEGKTRALRDVVYLSARVDALKGIFLLLDELEKGDISSSKTELLRYLQSMRALIDALPEYLFLMVALTPDALDRYREMQPALKGRLANEVKLPPLQSQQDALNLYRFYLDQAQKQAEENSVPRDWRKGQKELVSSQTAIDIYDELYKRRTIGGVRQRDYLHALHEKATEKINILTS